MGFAIRRETDEEVRQNIPPSLVDLFQRVRGAIKGSEHESRTEAFLRYVEEHPGEEIEAVERVAGLELKSVLRPMLDFYETPDWAIRPLGSVLPVKAGDRILDAGCGTGAILRCVGEMFPENEIRGVEKDETRCLAAREMTELPVDRGDFLLLQERFDIIVSNPPYSFAIEFVQKALTLAPVVAMLLRLPWLASQCRAEWHRENPAHVCVLPRRPSFTGDGKTDATEYAWFLWGAGHEGQWSILSVDRAIRRRR